ncbi:hypothetical protein Nepgr_000508 [Nepenthes gracilis]|uniref:Uncharacterized protein n=1 Tax=Nepenthes gracilis TaxID=150966 RepID=A0AAD3RW98_NEPGR|nr:hypothetical protein Nepgr_000508 [Nepenthes gracilis]
MCLGHSLKMLYRQKHKDDNSSNGKKLGKRVTIISATKKLLATSYVCIPFNNTAYSGKMDAQDNSKPTAFAPKRQLAVRMLQSRRSTPKYDEE